ncbi:MAG: RNA polymerase sigma factor FliA [Rhodanobacteraceae bacterium]
MSATEAYLAVQCAPPETLVVLHRDLIRRIACHLLARLPPNVELDDLIQAGTVGLIEAARAFRPDKGASFTTYAGIRIRGAMLDELRRIDPIPRSYRDRAHQITDAIRRVETRTHRAASEIETAEELGLSANEYASFCTSASQGPWLSLEDMPGSWTETLADDSDGPEETLQKSGFADALARGIEALPEKERLALALFYHEALTLKEIGAVLGVSKARVSQLHAQAEARLRVQLADWL